MILISDVKGNLTALYPEQLNQGSSNLNEILLFAPFVSSTVIYASFRLPNGIILYPKLGKNGSEYTQDENYGYRLTPIPGFDGAFTDPSGNVYNLWRISIDAPLTEFSGTLSIQLHGVLGAVVTSFSTVRAEIGNGVAYITPTVTESDINNISAWVAAAEQAMNNAETSAQEAADSAKEIYKHLYGMLKFEPTSNGEAYECVGFFTEEFLEEEIATVTHLVIPSVYNGRPVTSVKADAFRDCINIISVDIPLSVEKIGLDSFKGCTSIEYMSLPFVGNPNGGTQRKTNFGYLFGANSYTDHDIRVPESLKTVIVKGGTEIYEDTFRSCLYIETVILPETISSIGNLAFQGCTSLVKIKVPDSVTSIGNYAFSGCSSLSDVLVGDGVVTIGTNAFFNCTNIETLVLGKSLTSIGDNLFSRTKIKTVEIPDSVVSIGSWAFAKCTALSYVKINGGTIGNYAFGGCDLREIVIGENVTAFSAVNAFDENYNLEKLYYNAKNATVNERSPFTNCGRDNGGFSVVIGDTVEVIPGNLFKSYTGETTVPVYVKDITISENVKEIGADAFKGCDLQKVNVLNLYAWCNIDFKNVYSSPFYSSLDASLYVLGHISYYFETPCGITEIPAYAFCGCASIHVIRITESVLQIGASAFKGCRNLRDVIIESEKTSFGTDFIANNSVEALYLARGEMAGDDTLFSDVHRVYYNQTPVTKNEFDQSAVKKNSPDEPQTIYGDIVINGDLKVNGENYVVDAKTLFVKDQYVICNVTDDGTRTQSGFVIITNAPTISGNTKSYPAYGIVYDETSDSVRLGEGTVVMTDEGTEEQTVTFTFATNASQAIATRSDSIPDGNLVKWDAENKKLVDTQIPARLALKRGEILEDGVLLRWRADENRVAGTFKYDSNPTPNTFPYRNGSGAIRVGYQTGADNFAANIRTVEEAQSFAYVDYFTNSANATKSYSSFRFAAKGWRPEDPSVGYLNGIPTDKGGKWFQKIANGANDKRTLTIRDCLRFAEGDRFGYKLDDVISIFTDKIQAYRSNNNDLILEIAPKCTVYIQCFYRDSGTAEADYSQISIT